jgi:Coenzyme PQQ synthesis protein D (PqqD)
LVFENRRDASISQASLLGVLRAATNFWPSSSSRPATYWRKVSVARLLIFAGCRDRFQPAQIHEISCSEADFRPLSSKLPHRKNVYMKKNYEAQLAKARTAKLIIKNVDDEVLVYDLVNDKAHCLNRTAALVWKNCDGIRSITEIKAIVADELELPIDEQVVWLALDQLKEFNLLADAPSSPAVFDGLKRRELIRTLGIAAFALPVILTMTAPTAQAQGSCRPPGVVPGGCTAATNCCSGSCKNSSQCN